MEVNNWGEERNRRIPHSIEPHDGPTKRWDAPPFTATVKDVCRECNHNWMSYIEAEAKKHAEPLIRGEEDVLIDVDAQWAISRWAYLKVLVFERVAPAIAYFQSGDITRCMRPLKTFQHDHRVGGYEARIWPFSEPFNWPPRRALTDLGLEIFGGPRPGEVAPRREGFLRRLLQRKRYLQTTGRSQP